jgi:hypothetical protein
MLNVDCVVVNSVSFEMSGILNFKCELKKSAEGRGGARRFKRSILLDPYFFRTHMPLHRKAPPARKSVAHNTTITEYK